MKIVGIAQSVQNVKCRGLRTAVNHFSGKGFEWIHNSLHTFVDFEPKHEETLATINIAF